MSNLFFDLQRFAATVADGKVTIPAGNTYTLDGITYMAIEDAQLNLDSNNKISGIASGKVTATVMQQSNPTVTFDASDGRFLPSTVNAAIIYYATKILLNSAAPTLSHPPP